MKNSMQTQAIHRFFAILLTFALTIGLFPGIQFFSAKAEGALSGVAITYKFTLKAYAGDTSSDGTSYVDYSDARPWAFVAHTCSVQNSIGQSISLNANEAQVLSRMGEWAAIKVKVPAMGQYRASLTYRGRETTAIIETYIMPIFDGMTTDSISAKLTADNKKATLDTYRSSAQNAIYTSSLGTFDFPSAGEYLLVFKAANKSTYSSGYYMFPSNLSLDGRPISNANFSITENQIGVGESTKASAVTANYEDGTAADISKATIQYSSSAPDVASVDASTGSITAVSQGETDITATVVLGDLTLTHSEKLTVSNDYAVDRVEITGDSNIAAGGKTQLHLNAVLKNGSIIELPNTGASYTMTSVQPEGAVTLQPDYGVFGVQLGTASFTATTSFRGLNFTSAAFNVTVTEPLKSSSVVNISFMNSTGDPRQLTTYGDRSWAYVADKLTLSSSICLASCIQIVSKTNEWFAMKIKIPEAGIYKATYGIRGMTGGGYTSLFLIPAKQQSVDYIKNNLTSAYFVAKINGFAPVNETMKALDIGNIYVPSAGEYLFVLRSDGVAPGAWSQYMYPRTLTLEGEKALGSVSSALPDNATEIEVGKTAQIQNTIKNAIGDPLDPNEGGLSIVYSSSNPSIAAVDDNGLITAKGIGQVDIGVSVMQNNVTKENTLSLNVTDLSDVTSVEITGDSNVWVRGTLQLKQIAHLTSGNSITVPSSDMAYTVVSCEPEGAATVDANGLVTGVSVGTITVKGSANFRGSTWETNEFKISVTNSSKKESTIYTEEQREIVRENAEKYSWAGAEVKSIVADADIYVEKADILWNMVVAEGLPRDRIIGNRDDPKAFTCPYCGEDLRAKYGSYSWIIKPLTDPWKIQCPACKRRFPSNDFGEYYKSGLDEHGIFNKDLASQNGKDLLVNQLYPEKGDGWGVDDGLGYYTGETLSNGVKVRNSYIAHYLHDGIWYRNGKDGVLTDAVIKLSKAYAYTGEAKYGRTGAIVLDRIADVYPGFNWYQWTSWRGGANYRGKITDPVWECFLSNDFAKAYDALFPIYDDPQVISFLSQKATQYKLENPKNSAAAIRQNAEDGILREIHDAVLKGKIAGNFGMAQASLTAAAIALDTMPETNDWLQWLMKAGTAVNTGDPDKAALCTGGNILPKLVGEIDRDGNGTDIAPGYNVLWVSQLLDVAEMLHGYNKVDIDLYKNPKFAKMFTALIPLTLVSSYTAQIGDTGSTASLGTLISSYLSNSITGFNRLGTPELAQIIYMSNKKSVEGLHLPITERNPEGIQNSILDAVYKYGEFLPKSNMLAGYGFAVLRDGVKYDSAGINKNVNNLRDFWIFYGCGTGHGHIDGMNLGIDAYGLNMAPDLGYPADTGTEPNRIQFVRSNLSHNTVMVDGKEQIPLTVPGKPYHFDDGGRVKVMDMDTHQVYSATDIYRRTVVMVKVDDNVSYGVDFFRIRGGNDHIYSFHALSNEIFETEGLNLAAQTDSNGNYVGTYAGPSVPWGPDPKTQASWSTSYLQYPPGFTWLYDIRRDTAPQKQFSVDFKIKDFRRAITDNQNLHLRMTMLNDFGLSSLAIADAKPPQVAGNTRFIDKLEYVLARRTGYNIDSLFTTVYEPYKENRYIESMTGVTAQAIEGTKTSDDTVKAIKISHTNGRADYVIYSSNNNIKYRIDDKFDFRGFVGVYTMQGDQAVYSYLNDGDTIGDSQGNLPAYTGTVQDFTRDLNLKNTITIKTAQPVDVSKLVDKYIFVNNINSSTNGAYHILGATSGADGTTILDIGDVTLIRAYRDTADLSKGFAYNISSGQKFRIPLNSINDGSPVFTPVEEKTVDANSELSFTVNATSPAGKQLTYKEVTLPTGASFNPDTQAVTWIPDSKQQGLHHLSIEASDGALSSTLHIQVKVLGGTQGNGGSSPSGGSTSGSGSGTVNNGGSGTVVTPPVVVPPTAQERFSDLAGYDWAKDAINTLAQEGVINGTSVNTYTPGANVTRADFAILLVRALELKSDSSDNFSDVSANAYYANELSIAKGSGIVTGVGGNKFNPTAQISRQDMMVIIERAIEKSGITLEAASAEDLAAFSDSGSIDKYAADAVAKLVKNGLVTGSNGKINPKGRATRGEVAVIIQRIRDKKA